MGQNDQENPLPVGSHPPRHGGDLLDLEEVDLLDDHQILLHVDELSLPFVVDWNLLIAEVRPLRGGDLLLHLGVALPPLHLGGIDLLQGPLPEECVVVLSDGVLLFLQGAVRLPLDERVLLLEGLHSVDALALQFAGLCTLVQDLFHQGEGEGHLQDVGDHHPTLHHLVRAGRYLEGYQGVVVLKGL